MAFCLFKIFKFFIPFNFSSTDFKRIQFWTSIRFRFRTSETPVPVFTSRSRTLNGPWRFGSHYRVSFNKVCGTKWISTWDRLAMSIHSQWASCTEHYAMNSIPDLTKSLELIAACFFSKLFILWKSFRVFESSSGLQVEANLAYFKQIKQI